MYDDSPEFFYYFYLEEMQHADDDPQYFLPDRLSLQQLGDRMRQLRDERYYA
jgi:hypothetical protein